MIKGVSLRNTPLNSDLMIKGVSLRNTPLNSDLMIKGVSLRNTPLNSDLMKNYWPFYLLHASFYLIGCSRTSSFRLVVLNVTLIERAITVKVGDFMVDIALVKRPVPF